MPGRTAPFSERDFHAWARRHLAAGALGPLPLGDDTAAVEVDGAVALLTTDALVEGTHFLPSSPAEAVGRAVASASLSDVAAKGGRPVALLLDLLLPRTTPGAWARSVCRGAEKAMAETGAHLVGGDTKSSPHRVVVGTVLALADPRHLAPRSGARPGDLLVTTGWVGRGGSASLSLREGATPSTRELVRLLAIQPRLAEGRALVRHARAMLDTSDGIAESAHLLAEASHVRVEIDSALLPWDRALLRRVPEVERRIGVAFFGGDYELLASVPPGRVRAAQRAVREAGGTLTVVGRVGRGRGAVLRRDSGAVRALPRAGWDPFGRTRL